MNRARNIDHIARVYERFIYSIVKIKRLCDYQTWQTFLEKFIRCAVVPKSYQREGQPRKTEN